MVERDDAAAGGVLVLAPMTLELKAVVKALALAAEPSDADPTGPSHRGVVGSTPVDAVVGGIGFEASAGVVATQLDRCRYDRVVVCGIAGGLRPGIAIGELVVPERVVDLESDAEFRPAPLAGTASAGALACHTELIVDPDAIAGFVARGFDAIDMETAAVAALCEERGCAWSVVRAISDRAGDDTLDGSVMDLTNPDGSVRAGAAARYLLTHPGRIPHLTALARGAGLAARNAALALAGALRAS
jgi:adenosylhomocysteine nucleosidase